MASLLCTFWKGKLAVWYFSLSHPSSVLYWDDGGGVSPEGGALHGDQSVMDHSQVNLKKRTGVVDRKEGA